MTVLINELAGYPGDDKTLLVLDDYHLIGSEHVHLSLGFLLEHPPPSVHLVLATRTDPPLRLARLRARRRRSMGSPTMPFARRYRPGIPSGRPGPDPGPGRGRP